MRAREDARADLMRARHRLSKMLLRHGRVYDMRAWTLAHDAWLRAQRLDQPPAQAALDDYYEAALAAVLRRDRLDAAIAELARRPDLAPLVGRLSCLRGVSTLTAVGLAVEVGDWHRLSGASIGAYLGLTPTESQFGRAPRPRADHQGRQRPRPPPPCRGRLAPPPAAAGKRRARAPPRWPRPAVRARAERAGLRLHRRWVHLERRRGLRATLVAVAVARELAGWCWSLAVMDD